MNTLAVHFDSEKPLTFNIRANIVHIPIADMLFDPEEDNAIQARDRALGMFSTPAESEAQSQEQAMGREMQITGEIDKTYVVNIRSSQLFWLVVGFVARGASFRSAASFTPHLRKSTNISAYDGGSEGRVAHFIRVVYASNLQRISEKLLDAWAFGIALDAGSTSGTNYLDIRVQFEDAGLMKNVPLMPIPLFQGKTASILFHATSKLLDTPASEWKDALLG